MQVVTHLFKVNMAIPLAPIIIYFTIEETKALIESPLSFLLSLFSFTYSHMNASRGVWGPTILLLQFGGNDELKIFCL